MLILCGLLGLHTLMQQAAMLERPQGKELQWPLANSQRGAVASAPQPTGTESHRAPHEQVWRLILTPQLTP